MTLPADRYRRADYRWRWSQAGDDDGCPLQPAALQIDRHSPGNRTGRSDPQPPRRPTSNPAGSARRPLPRSGSHPATPKSP